MLDPDISTGDSLALLSQFDDDSRKGIDRRRFLRLVGMGLGAGVAGSIGGALKRLHPSVEDGATVIVKLDGASGPMLPASSARANSGAISTIETDMTTVVAADRTAEAKGRTERTTGGSSGGDRARTGVLRSSASDAGT